mgnify:FL=1
MQLFHLRKFIFLTLANNLPRFSVCDQFRAKLLAWAGMDIGRNVVVWGPVTIRPIGAAKNVVIGNSTFLNTETRFGCPEAKISIGNHVQIGPRVSFETVNHGLIYKPGIGRGSWTKPITIEDEVWVSAGATILQGVTIGRGAVITAGAIVNRDVAPYTIVGGVPAKFISAIESGPAEEDIGCNIGN